MQSINTIQDICMNTVKYNNLYRLRIFSKAKLKRTIKQLESDFLSLDIFDQSIGIMGILLTIKENYSSRYIDYVNNENDHICNVSELLLKLNINNRIQVTYFKNSNKFDVLIVNEDYKKRYSFEVYKNLRLSRKASELWESTINILSNEYMDIIHDICVLFGEGYE